MQMEPMQVVQLGLDICDELMQRDNIHEAIKAENILMAKGRYRLGSENTTGMPCGGDYSCMAPEVYWGEGYDKRLDIYALGLVMYTLLNNGCPPLTEPGFDEEQLREASLRRLEGETLPLPAHGSQQLQQVVLKACAYEPNQRYADAQQMAAALKEVI